MGWPLPIARQVANLIGSMGRGIVHFMWGYQPDFRTHQECDAERLFQKLDKRFKPEIFLVGILDYGVTERFPACVEPEEEYWIRSEDFNDVRTIADEIRPTYPEAGMFQSHPIAQKRQDEDLLKRSIRDGVLRVIESHPLRPAEIKFYASYPARIGCYWVSVVLGLQRTFSTLTLLYKRAASRCMNFVIYQ
jgi:hypothetical protein